MKQEKPPTWVKKYFENNPDKLVTTKALVFSKPNPEYNMGVDCYNGNAAFVVMRKDGEVMEYGNGKDDAIFRAEVERAAKYYNIQPSEILKETD